MAIKRVADVALTTFPATLNTPLCVTYTRKFTKCAALPPAASSTVTTLESASANCAPISISLSTGPFRDFRDLTRNPDRPSADGGHSMGIPARPLLTLREDCLRNCVAYNHHSL